MANGTHGILTRCVATITAAAMFLNSSVALAEAPIGSAVKVINKVTAELDRTERDLATNDVVRQNELIAVSDDGLGEIVLADETKLALGGGARLTLDKFVYDPDKTSGSIVLNMTRGAFRFVTGLAKKPSYVIRTPTASITVRGTIFDVYIEESGAIWMLLHEGSVQVCNDRGECRRLDDPCRAVRVDGGGSVGAPGNWNGLRRSEDVEFATAFPFVISPPDIDPQPRFEQASIERGVCATERIKPDKPRRAEPRDPPAKKSEPVKKAKKVEPKPEPVKKAKREEPPKKKYTEKPRSKSNDDAKKAAAAAAAIGIAIGVGIAIGNKNKGGGGSNYKPKPEYSKPKSEQMTPR